MTSWGKFRARRARARLVVALLAGGLVATGCSATINAESAARQDSGAAEAAALPLSLELTPKNKTIDVVPGDPVTAKAGNGTLAKVSLIGANGRVVKGGIKADGSRWVSGEPLGYGKTYTLTAQGTGNDGMRITRKSTFTTVVPDRQVSVQMSIADGATVGVGMPVSFAFSGPITDKKAAERALKVITEPKAEGGFYWFSDSWVTWRPKKYWRPGTEVKVRALIYGKDLGGGTFGAEDRTARMTIGDKVVAVADGRTHQMTVKINNRKVRTIPIAMGKPTHPTPHGKYTVMSEHRPYTMDSSTYGVSVDSPEGYKITVTHAARMSYSGIFYHSAPWSVWAQGAQNVSHGCINMSTADADWLMKHSRPGDLIKVVNSGGPKLEPTDGWSVWQLSWREWQTGGKA
ncbi:MAG: L,D-transpeptidase [Haloechinothrix sp.]